MNIEVQVITADPFTREVEGWGSKTQEVFTYIIEVAYEGRGMVFYFYQGLGLKNAPTEQEVLTTLAQDYRYNEFEYPDFLDDLTFAEASRIKAKLDRASEDMQRVFGEDLQQFLDEYEEE